MTTLELGKKRCEDLGLAAFNAPTFGSIDKVYPVECIHRLLGEGQEYFWTPHGDAGMVQKPKHTHRALGIGIRPIVKESPERALLRELSTYKDWQHEGGKPSLFELIDRARALLKEGE